MILTRTVAAALACLAVTAHAESPRAAAWWGHVAVLADDAMEGRVAGSPGYARAADYVAERFKAYGLAPAGTEGFLQPIAFETVRIDAARSRAALVAEGKETPLAIGDTILIGSRGAPPATIDAPLVFVGYGLHMPEAGHDDFEGVDLTGKIAVWIAGGPQHVSGALKSHARATRPQLLERMGAVGGIAIDNPNQMEVPWTRQKGNSGQTGLVFAEVALRDTQRPLLGAAFDPGAAEWLFARSGRRFAGIVAAATASRPIAGFALNQALRATIVSETGTLSAPNIVGLLAGSDPTLKAEHVVLSAHLDGLGVGKPVDGDAIYNGAMDNASGVASLLEIARGWQAGRVRPKRSILFVVVTGEEKGLLGARYFARKPSVAKASLVADINLDMPLPLWPLESVLVLGEGESSLGADARAVAKAQGLRVIADPLPDRNSFIRSDQYAFIEQGIPALFPKFGFEAGTKAFDLEKAFRATRYHAPSDDLAQPVAREDAVRFNDYLAALALRVADAPERPAWNGDSFFRRFAN